MQGYLISMLNFKGHLYKQFVYVALAESWPFGIHESRRQIDVAVNHWSAERAKNPKMGARHQDVKGVSDHNSQRMSAAC